MSSYREHVVSIVNKLRDSFETKHSDICNDTAILREIIAFYDAILIILIAKPPKNRKEMMNFLEEYCDILLEMPPILQTKMTEFAKEFFKIFFNGHVRIFEFSKDDIKTMCPEHPILSLGIEQKIYYTLGDHFLINRNFLAVYIGDPIKTLNFYKNISQSVS